MSLREKLLQAFAAEHPVLTARLRETFARGAAGEAPAPGEGELDEAYRAAHSLKGAARVCDFAGIEGVAGALQSLLGALRKGGAALDRAGWEALLDVVGALAEAAGSGGEGVDLSQAEATVRRYLPEAVPRAGLASRLLAAFRAESQEHLEAIRRIVDRAATTGVLRPAEVDESFRRAHSLKGAARVNALADVEHLAHALENSFSRLRGAGGEFDEAARRAIGGALDSIEDAAAAAVAAATPAPAAVGEAAARPPGDGAGEAAPEGPATRSGADGGGELASVRVSAPALDNLLDLAGEVIALCALEGVRGGRERPGARGLRRVAEGLFQAVRAARFIPASTAFQGFRKMVRDLARTEGKRVEVEVTGLGVEADRIVLQAIKDPVMHLLRNAVSHGVETPAERRARGKPEAGRVALRVRSDGNRIDVEVEDDGAGIDDDRVRQTALERGLIGGPEGASPPRETLLDLIFHPGFSTYRSVSETSGRGMGLSVVRTAAERLQGEVSVLGPGPGKAGTRFRLRVPLSLATQRLALVRAAGRDYGLPLAGIERVTRVSGDEIEAHGGVPCLRPEAGSAPVPVLPLAGVVGSGWPPAPRRGERWVAAVLAAGEERLALLVESVSEIRDAVVKELPPAAAAPGGAPALVSGALAREDGSVVLVLDPGAVLRAFPGGGGPGRSPGPWGEGGDGVEDPSAGGATVLVVDDSFTTRTLEKIVLETAGYEVLLAVDGVDGLNRLRAERERVAVAVIDVEMPRMDGFTLLSEIKADPELSAVPVILVTSLDRPADVERGMALGAEAYIVKRRFDQQELLRTVERVL